MVFSGTITHRFKNFRNVFQVGRPIPLVPLEHDEFPEIFDWSIKFSLSKPGRNVGELEVQLHSFVAWACDGGERSSSRKFFNRKKLLTLVGPWNRPECLMPLPGWSISWPNLCTEYLNWPFAVFSGLWLPVWWSLVQCRFFDYTAFVCLNEWVKGNAECLWDGKWEGGSRCTFATLRKSQMDMLVSNQGFWG